MLRGNRRELPQQPETPGVATRLLGGQRLATELLNLVAEQDLARARAVDERHRAREQGSGRVARPFGPTGEIVRCRRALTGVEGVHPPGDLELEREVQPNRAQQLRRAAEKRMSRPIVASAVRSPPAGTEPLSGTLDEDGIGPTELSLVPHRLLEVVSNDLVAFDQRVAVPVEPVGKAGVEIGADGLG